MLYEPLPLNVTEWQEVGLTVSNICVPVHLRYAVEFMYLSLC